MICLYSVIHMQCTYMYAKDKDNVRPYAKENSVVFLSATQKSVLNAYGLIPSYFIHPETKTIP